MDSKQVEQSMGNRTSTDNADLEESNQSSIDIGEYESTMADFVTPKSQMEKMPSTKQSSTPLNLDTNDNSEDETSDTDEGDTSPERNVTQDNKQQSMESTIAEEESVAQPPAKKQKIDQNLNFSKASACDDSESSQNSVFLGKFNFRAMDEPKRRFFENAATLNKTIRLTLPKSHDQRLRGFGFLEVVSEDATELRDNLEQLLECPSCFERLHPPVTGCVNGHALCKNCEEKGVDQCSVCNALFIKGRYYFMNNIINNFQFRCKFAEFGCSLRSTPNDLTAHEKFCNFRVVKCPLSNEGEVCDLMVAIPSYPEHVESHHESYVKTPFTLNTDYECVLPKKEKLETGNCFYRFFKDVVNRLNFLEMTHYDEHFKTYTISIHFIGKEAEAPNYIYTIDVTGDNILKQFKCSRDCLPNIMPANEAEKYFLFSLTDREDKFSVHKELKYNLRIEKKEDFGKSSFRELSNGTYEDTFSDIPVLDI